MMHPLRKAELLPLSPNHKVHLPARPCCLPVPPVPAYEEIADKVEKTLMFQKQGEVYKNKLDEVKAKFGDIVSYM